MRCSAPPAGDHTPSNYALPRTDWREKVKRPMRAVLYPAWNAFTNRVLSARYATSAFRPDQWLWGQRGNDYERHRRRVDRFLPLAGKDVLVVGCGTGRDIESWARMRPKRIVGLDWFDYERAWGLQKEHFARIAPGTVVEFLQGDVERLAVIKDVSFDVVASDAVFEHLVNMQKALRQFRRVLRPNGVLYACFGPLWYSWGGDHVSGYDALNYGFNHLLLDTATYRCYLDGMGPYEHSENDGRTFIDHDMFSRLRPGQYLEQLTCAGFERLFVGSIIEPRAVQCLRQFPQVAAQLLPQHDLLDMVVAGMYIIYRRVPDGR